MSRLKKTFLILQVCFSLTYLFWLCLQPYVKNTLSKKYTQSLYQMVLERKDLFSTLDAETQKQILVDSNNVFTQARSSYLTELKILFFQQTPPFALAWLFFSLTICCLVIFNIENASKVAWILPACVLFYPLSFQANSLKTIHSLFPKEDYILKNYLNHIEDAKLNSREKLLKGWQRYLITEWLHETPNQDQIVYNNQLDKGLFFFNVARLKWLKEGKGDENIFSGFYNPPSSLLLLLYFIWNVSFAWIMNSKQKSSLVSVALSSN